MKRPETETVIWNGSERSTRKMPKAKLCATIIDAAIRRVQDRVRAAGLGTEDVPRDGSCAFHSLAWWIRKLLGNAGARQLLGSAAVNGAAVRAFLCDWAEENFDIVLGDEGGERVAELAVRAALHDWPRPVGAFSELPPEKRLAAQFAAVITRMRRNEWADEFWVTALAPAALGFKVDIKSAIGGLTSPGRAVRCAATRGGSARVRTRTHRVMGCMTVRMGRWGGTVASGIVRGAIVALGSM